MSAMGRKRDWRDMGAVDGMRRYPILLPNAPDAQTARNQIALRQRKMGD